MCAGFHLNMFDSEGAEALACEARELGRSAGFAPSIVSSGIDLLLIFARRHDVAPAEALLAETVAAVATTPGWHEWLWRLRLCQARAELALARGAYADAVAEASEGIRQSHTRADRSTRRWGSLPGCARCTASGRPTPSSLRPAAASSSTNRRLSPSTRQRQDRSRRSRGPRDARVAPRPRSRPFGRCATASSPTSRRRSAC